ncbi:MAG: WXG100 family type VII secretion target [Lachnospiraceae bacterium]|jgi:WXG100 family type VII secretion target|nr:WXG100 family type VII secretion target [Lachnospiraceae bacterium]
MGMIQVTARQLRSEAEKIQQLNHRYKNQITVLAAKEQSLGAMWEGQAKESFRDAFLRDREQMEEFYRLIGKYVQALHQIATKYEQVEQRNVEIITSRNY